MNFGCWPINITMGKLILQPTSTAHWYSLVCEAESAQCICLKEEIESYLVFLLMRFMVEPEIASSVMGLDFLESLNATGREGELALRDVGDKCLLYAGFFPGRAEKRRVKLSYYVDIGQSAYASLALRGDDDFAHLFNGLCSHFVTLMDTLHTMRELHSEQISLTPAQAKALWEDTGSRRALEILRRYGK